MKFQNGNIPWNKKPALERFWDKVKIVDSGCWEWQGYLTRGYGYLKDGKKLVAAHRFAFRLLKGGIPEGMTLDHLCRNRCCVNPDHLEIVTMRTNTLRGNGISAKCARATHCPQGHPYDLFNTYLYPNGNRRCRICRREQMRQYSVWRIQSERAEKPEEIRQ